MKKLAYSLIAILIAAAFAACTNNGRNELIRTIEKSNTACPQSIGNGLTMVSISYDETDNDAVFTYSYTEEYSPVSSIALARESQLEFMSNYLKSSEGQKFLDLLVKADAGIKIKFNGEKTHESISIDISSEEIRRIDSAEVSEDMNMAQIKAIIASTNAQCPVKIDDDLVMESATIEDAFIIFRYSYNSDIYDFSNLDRSEMQQTLTESLRQELNTPVGHNQLKLMKILHLGTKYIYIPSDGGQDQVFTITADTIKTF